MALAMPETDLRDVAHRLAAWLEDEIEEAVGILPPVQLADRIARADMATWRAVAEAAGLAEPSMATVIEARRLAASAARRGTTPSSARPGSLR